MEILVFAPMVESNGEPPGGGPRAGGYLLNRMICAWIPWNAGPTSSAVCA
jgi:hypothetical protein